MPIEVTMAKLSPTMESGQLVRWLVKVGDTVKEGDTLAEIQTDKAVMPMEAFDEGTVAVLDAKEGDELALGQRVLVLAKKGEDPKQVAQEAGRGQARPGGAAEPSTAVGAVAAGSDPARVSTGSPSGTPGPNGESVADLARRPRPAEPAAAGLASSSPSVPAAVGRVRSTPLARKIAAASGLDIAQIAGSGPGGRVIRSDVEAALQAGGERPSAAAPAAARPTGVPGQTSRIPHSPMRKTIARRMAESKQTVPEIHVTVDIRMDAVMAVRARLNESLEKDRIKLSVGDFVTKAVALALRKHPGVNASFEADATVIHPDVNLGIAVAIEGGLMVPVLHHADQLGLLAIRQGTEALAAATRAGTLKPSQMMGGTFTISNLGMYGVRQFDAIINLPEVAILAVGATEQRPVVQDGQLAVGWLMSVTLTADHRAVDGALAAEFLRTVKGLLEEPSRMLL